MKKRSRIIRFFVVLILMFSLLYVEMPVVYGIVVPPNIGSYVTPEGGTRPEETPDHDDPTSPPTSGGTPGETGPRKETVKHQVGISGNIYENWEEAEIKKNQPNQTEVSNASDYLYPVKGQSVMVKAVSGDEVYTTWTDANGYYSFPQLPSDSWTLEFYFGKIEDNNILNDAERVKNILRYNGQDYMVTETPSGSIGGIPNTITKEGAEATNIGGACAQVVLAIDCSSVMRSQTYVINGVEKTRLEVAVDSAKELIDLLFDSGENIYISLVFFSGTSYKAKSLYDHTQKENLKTTLDALVANGWYTHLTDCVSALEVADEFGFWSEELTGPGANKTLIMITDGVACKAPGAPEIYSDSSEEEVAQILQQVGQMTQNKVLELREKGIKLYSLLVESSEEESIYAKSIFEGTADKCVTATDGQDLVDLITEDVKQYIIGGTNEHEYIEPSSPYSYSIQGLEDKERASVVNNNFTEKFTYDGQYDSANSTMLFDQITNYDANSQASREAAVELSEKSWMKVVAGTYYIGESGGGKVENIDEDGDGEIDLIRTHVDVLIEGQNVVVTRKSPFSLLTKVTVTGLKITLSDGSTLDIHSREIGVDLPIIQSIDDELTHGATVQIEYSVCIYNNSNNIQCNYLELINYLPEGFIYTPETDFITQSGKNKDYGWENVSSLQEYKDYGFISENTLNTYQKRNAIRLVLDNNGKGKDGFYIPSSGEYVVKFVASRVISNLYDLDLDYDVLVEVLSYKNSRNRRMMYSLGGKQETESAYYYFTEYFGMYPGNSKENDCSKTTNDVFIIPPTGIGKYTTQITIIGTVLISAIVATLVRRKKKQQNKCF